MCNTLQQCRESFCRVLDAHSHCHPHIHAYIYKHRHTHSRRKRARTNHHTHTCTHVCTYTHTEGKSTYKPLHAYTHKFTHTHGKVKSTHKPSHTHTHKHTHVHARRPYHCDSDMAYTEILRVLRTYLRHTLSAECHINTPWLKKNSVLTVKKYLGEFPVQTSGQITHYFSIRVCV